MRRSTLRLAAPVLAAALMLGVAAVPARAYFTASDEANGGMVTGWLQLGKNWYYFDENGVMLTGTQVIGGKEHHFTADGVWIN